MELSLQDVGSLITFVAPGYVAIQIYMTAYAKRERNFSHLLVESVVLSLPIVTLTGYVWETLLNRHPVSALTTSYAALLMLIAVLVGILLTYGRTHWPVKWVAAKFGLGSPDEDFVKLQFLRLRPNQRAVTVMLKSGGVFSGVPDRTNRYSHSGLKYYYFGNVMWLNSEDEWEEREGGIIIERNEIEYIETPKLKDE